MKSVTGLFRDSLRRKSSRGLIKYLLTGRVLYIPWLDNTDINGFIYMLWVFMFQTVGIKLQTSMLTGMCSQHDYKGTACHCNRLMSFCLF